MLRELRVTINKSAGGRLTTAVILRVLNHNQMIVFNSQTIILAVIGMVGLLSTATVLVASFKRNRLARGNYQ